MMDKSQPYSRDELYRIWIERFKNDKALWRERTEDPTDADDALNLAVSAMMGVLEDNNRKVYEDFNRMLEQRFGERD